MSLPALLRRLLVCLFTRPCRSCETPVGLLADICEDCVEHLPTGLRWALRGARDARWRDRITYRVMRDVARKNLARHSKRHHAEPQTTTTVKEKP